MRLRKSNALLFCRPCISLRDLHNHDKDPPKEVKYTISVAVTVFFFFLPSRHLVCRSKILRLVAGYLGVDFKLGKFGSQTKRCPFFLGCTTCCSLYIHYMLICCLVMSYLSFAFAAKYLSQSIKQIFIRHSSDSGSHPVVIEQL